jgi:hypothetical protein
MCFPVSPLLEQLVIAKMTPQKVYSLAGLIGDDGLLTDRRSSWIDALDKFKDETKNEDPPFDFKGKSARDLFWPSSLVTADKAYLAFMKDIDAKKDALEGDGSLLTSKAKHLCFLGVLEDKEQKSVVYLKGSSIDQAKTKVMKHLLGLGI